MHQSDDAREPRIPRRLSEDVGFPPHAVARNARRKETERLPGTPPFV
jgi:hypothetical protein